MRQRPSRSAPLSGPWGDLRNAPATNTSDLEMDTSTEQVMLLRNTMLLLYSPECVEGAFCEVACPSAPAGAAALRPLPYAS